MSVSLFDMCFIQEDNHNRTLRYDERSQYQRRHAAHYVNGGRNDVQGDFDVIVSTIYFSLTTTSKCVSSLGCERPGLDAISLEVTLK